MISRAGEGFPQYWIASEFAVCDRLVNSRQVLIDDPAGSQVKMANFRVAHLSIGQADVSPARAQFSTGIVPVELVVKRRLREERCVRIFFALLSTARIDAPAIANNQHDRTSHMRALCRRFPRSTSGSSLDASSLRARTEMIKGDRRAQKAFRATAFDQHSLIFATVIRLR